MATRISKLKWDEISGVDHPANETPGWILQKAAGEVADFETAVVELHKALGSDAAELFFKDADESVRKAVKRVFKHLDESLEEVNDEDGDEDGDEEKVEKRGLSKLAEILGATLTKSDDGDEDDETSDDDSGDEGDSSDGDEGDEDEGEGGDDDESGDDETSDEDDDKGGDDEDGDEPVSKSSKLQKSDVDAIVSAFKEELDPLREAVGALADRTDGLEKHAAGRTSLLGQDGSEDEGDEDEKAGLHKAITGAIRTGEKITLT